MTITHEQYLKRINLKLPFTIASVSTLAVALSACQTTSLSSKNLSGAQSNPELAKSALVEAIQNQRRRAYAYQSHVIISNQARQQALANASPQQLAMADDSSEHCEHVHDQGYIALMEQAEAEGKDVNASDYSARRQALKSAFLNCDSKYRQWEAQYNDDYESDAEYSSDEEADSIDEDSGNITSSVGSDTLQGDTAQAASEVYKVFEENKNVRGASSSAASTQTDASVDLAEAKAEVADAEAEIAEANAKFADAAEDEESYQEFLPNYDGDHTKLDVKKAKLLEAYLLKPLKLSAQGIYQPRAGVYTLLPTMTYQTRNHITAINQPIYIDAKEGAIYFWAANFAYPLSERLDDRLGNQWDNKWLKLSLNDGSLPEGFGRDLIKAHFAALDSAYDSTSSSDYRFIDSMALAQLTPALPASQLSVMRHANTIVGYQQGLETHDKFTQHYADVLYQQLTEKYPELLKDDNKDSETGTEQDSSDLTDAGADADMVPEEQAISDTDIDENEGEPWFTSKLMVVQLLKLLKELSAGEEKADAADPIDPLTTTAQENKVADIPYVKVQPKTAINLPVVQELYGLNNRGQVLWHHYHEQIAAKNSFEFETAEGVNVDILTEYQPLSAASIAFPNLPQAAQRPTANNSIDIKQYIDDLADYYDNGGGTEVGKELYSMLRMMRLMAKLRLDPEAMSDEMEEDEVTDEEEEPASESNPESNANSDSEINDAIESIEP